MLTRAGKDIPRQNQLVHAFAQPATDNKDSRRHRRTSPYNVATHGHVAKNYAAHSDATGRVKVLASEFVAPLSMTKAYRHQLVPT